MSDEILPRHVYIIRNYDVSHIPTVKSLAIYKICEVCDCINKV